jgi:K+-transporting ATPase A subunit
MAGMTVQLFLSCATSVAVAMAVTRRSFRRARLGPVVEHYAMQSGLID